MADLSKVVSFLTDKHSNELYDRHAIAVGKAAKEHAAGFVRCFCSAFFHQFIHPSPNQSHVREVDKATIIVDHFRRCLAEGRSEFIRPATSFLQICGVPLIHDDAHDIINHPSSLNAILTSVSMVLSTVSNAEVCAAAVSTIHAIFDFIMQDGTYDEFGGLRAPIAFAPLLDNPAVIDGLKAELQRTNGKNSSVSLSASGTLSGGDSDRLHSVMAVLKVLSQNRAAAEQLTEGGILGELIALLSEHPYSDLSSFNAYHIAWNVLDLCPRAASVLGSLSSLQAIRSQLSEILEHGYKTKDKELRNDMLVILIQAAHEPSTWPNFLESGIPELLGAYSLASELQRAPDYVRPFIMTGTAEDFEMKRAMWSLMLAISGDDNAVPMLVDIGFIRVLCMYADPHCSNTAMARFARNQRSELQLLSLQLLSVALRIPSFCEEFLEMAGVPVCVQVLGEHIGDEFGASALKVLLASSAHSNARKAMCSYPAVTAGILEMYHMLSHSWQQHSVTLSDAASLLSTLISEVVPSSSSSSSSPRPHSDSISQPDSILVHHVGVGHVISLLQSVSASAEVQRGDDVVRLLCASIDCLWAVMSNNDAQLQILAVDGVNAVLNIVERYRDDEMVYVASLGLLADLLHSNPESRLHVAEWMSDKTGSSAARLLISLWNLACSSIDVLEEADEPDSVMALQPSEMQEKERKERKFREAVARGKVRDNKIDIRARVYSIFRYIGFEEHDDLSPSDKVVLTIIQEYARIRGEEAWRSVTVSLGKAQVRPVSADARKLEAHKKLLLNSASIIKTTQQTILQEKQLRDLEEEQALYRKLRPVVDERSKPTSLLKTAARRRSHKIKGEIQAAPGSDENRMEMLSAGI